MVKNMKEKIKQLKDAISGNVDGYLFWELIDDTTRYNRNIAMAFSVFALTFISITLIISFFLKELSSSSIVYFAGTVISCAILFIAYKGKNNLTLTWISVYMSEFFYLFYGLSIGLFTRPNVQTTTFMVMMVLLPIIFVDRPVTTNMILIVYFSVFSIGAYYLKSESIKYVDIMNAIIFGLLACASGTIVNYMRLKGFVLENKLKILSEKDQLTGLKNRNSFEWNLEKYEDTYENRIACIYIDVNGLHEVNNTQGHKYGDKMLQYIAKQTQEVFGENHTYRIGGDEYVSFVFDDDIDKLILSLQILSRRVNIAGYHIAVGYSVQHKKKFDIETLIKDAEKMMYKQKDNYYSKMRKKNRNG